MLHGLKRQLSTGQVIEYDGQIWTIIGKAAGEVELASHGGPRPRIWKDVSSLVAASDFRVLDEDPDGLRGDALSLDGLPREVRAAAEMWARHVYEVIHGAPGPTEEPRPEMVGLSHAERREQKVKELNAVGIKASRSTMLRKERAYQENGVLGLIDGRAKREVSECPDLDERVKEVIEDLIAGATNQSTVGAQVWLARVRHQVTRRYPGEDVPVPSDSTLRRAFHALDGQNLLPAKATTRRTIASRPKRKLNKMEALYPGQYVLMDSTPLDCTLKDARGVPMRDAHVVGAIDLATRCVVGVNLFWGSVNSQDLSEMVHRMALPWPTPEGLQEMSLSMSAVLPARAMLAVDPNLEGAVAAPFIWPETAVTDLGADYTSHEFRDALNSLGISIEHAPPGAGWHKGQVERFFGTMRSNLLEYLPGYVGNNVENKGRWQKSTVETVDENGKTSKVNHYFDPDSLTFEEMQARITEWALVVYHNTPHSELRDPDAPARKSTPNQMYAASFDALGGVPIPVDETTVIRSLKREDATVLADGVRVNNVRYDAEELADLRGNDTKREVRVDRYDRGHVWLWHPKLKRYVELFSRDVHLPSLPFGASTIQNLRTTATAVSPHGEWIQTQLNVDADRRAAAKAAKRAMKKSTRAKQQAATPTPRPRPSEVTRPAPKQPDPSEGFQFSPTRKPRKTA